MEKSCYIDVNSDFYSISGHFSLEVNEKDELILDNDDNICMGVSMDNIESFKDDEHGYTLTWSL